MTGSPSRGHRCRTRGLPLLLLAAAALAGAPGTVQAQDTLIVADTTLVPDSVLLLPDTLPRDSLPPDTTVRVLPDVLGLPPEEAPGVRVWDLDALIRSPAFTLRELLAPLAGAIPQRTGDFGSPQGMVFEGMAGGRLRVFLDGMEQLSIDGSVPDLAQISLAGVEEVHLSTQGGETRVHLRTIQAREPQPQSMVEVGTGDLDTNFFRGSFVHPDAFGGGINLAFERIDTRGRADEQDGTLQAIWLRYFRPLGERFALSGQYRRRTAETVFQDLAPPATRRSDLSLSFRARLGEGVTAEAFAVRTSLDLSEDSIVAENLRVRQFGGRVGVERGPFALRAETRYIDGAAGDQPSLRADADLSYAGRLGGVAGRVGFDRFEGGNRTVQGVSAWTGRLLGLSAYASWDSGERGWTPLLARALERQPDSLEVAPLTGSDRTALRAGLRFDLGPVGLDAAWLRTEVDSVLPLGNRVDLGTASFPGDEATGYEVSGRVALWPRGVAATGSFQSWESEGFYRPERIYRGGLTFARTFYPTGNLEFNAGFLVEGRDGMLLPLADPLTGDPTRVPFYQSWNAHLMIRVVTVRLFLRWENLFLRQNNQDLPGRLLPTTRVMYGVRWTLRN